MDQHLITGFYLVQVKTDGAQDAYYNTYTTTSGTSPRAFYDPQKQFGKILGGTWAPYPLVASFYSISPSGGSFPARIFGGPGFNNEVWREDPYFDLDSLSTQNGLATRPDQGNTDLRKPGSVLIVYSRDKSKWTRCVVLEMQEKAQLSDGNAFFFWPRNHQSVDKDGNNAAKGSGSSTSPGDANYISETGMGWFPGYAINLKRVNALTWLLEKIVTKKKTMVMICSGIQPVIMISHIHMPWVENILYTFLAEIRFPLSFYLSGSTGSKWEPLLNGVPYGVGRYDGGKRIMDILKVFFSKTVFQDKLSGQDFAPLDAVIRDIMWVGIPMPKSGFEFSDGSKMASDVRDPD